MGAITWNNKVPPVGEPYCNLCGVATDMVCCGVHRQWICSPCYLKWQGDNNFCDFNWDGFEPWGRLTDEQMIEALREMEMELR